MKSGTELVFLAMPLQYYE